MKKTMCRLFGHKLNPDALEYGGFYECLSCGEQSYDPIPARWMWTYWLSWWLRDKFQRQVSGRFKRCNTCGLRNYKHTDACNQIPF